MLTLRPIDPVAIEKRLESPDALVISASASTIDAADVDETPSAGETPIGRNPSGASSAKGQDGRSAPAKALPKHPMAARTGSGG